MAPSSGAAAKRPFDRFRLAAAAEAPPPKNDGERAAAAPPAGRQPRGPAAAAAAPPPPPPAPPRREPPQQQEEEEAAMMMRDALEALTCGCPLARGVEMSADELVASVAGGVYPTLLGGSSPRLALVTGPGGSGKTTLVERVAQAAAAAGRPVFRLAPTHMAARRMGRDAQTLHRWFYARGAAASRNAVVVVDEASMVDAEWMARVLAKAARACGPLGVVLLVGDPAQLPPVGEGRPFADLLALPAAERPPAVLLRAVHRQQRGSPILALAAAVRAGDARGALELLARHQAVEEQGDGPAKQQLELRVAREPADVLRHCSALYEEEGFRRGAGGAGQHGRLLCPACAPDAAVSTLTLGAAVRRRQVELGHVLVAGGGQHHPFAAGDRVVNVRNTGALRNGDTGTVLEATAGGSVLVQYDDAGAGRAWHAWAAPAAPQRGSNAKKRGRAASVSHDTADLELGYCLTVHRAQGAQFHTCVLALHASMSPALLSRPLLYTAVTRACARLVIVGTAELVARACANAGGA